MSIVNIGLGIIIFFFVYTLAIDEFKKKKDSVMNNIMSTMISNSDIIKKNSNSDIGTKNIMKKDIMENDINIIKSVSLKTAPVLEKFSNYAPADPNYIKSDTILQSNKIIPDYLVLASQSLNTYKNTGKYSYPEFTSERRNAWHDKIGNKNLSYYFKDNPKSELINDQSNLFDDIQKEAVPLI